MDRRVAAPEDLSPLDLRELRQLDLDGSAGPGRAAHVSAASGVVQRGDFVYVIGDDELVLAVFQISRDAPGRTERVLSGALPSDSAARKQAKPDLEALTVLPPHREHPHGALLGLGSGSTPTRDRGFLWALAPDGSLHGRAREIDLAPLYTVLRERVEDLNIEGAAVMGRQLWLLQRGNGPRGENLSPLGGELLVFTASAESSPNTYEDGEILGSVVGTVDLDGEVRRLRTIDRRYKVEGVHATLDTGVVTLTFVCDQDDPEVSSPLLAATMPLEREVEG